MHLKTIALVAIFLVLAETLTENKVQGTPTENNFVVHMPGAQPRRNDDYLCAGLSLKNLSRPKLYFTGFDVNANTTTVSHVKFYRCKSASANLLEGAVYSCRNTDTFLEYVCHTSYFIFNWGRNAGPLSLPENVGFEVDRDDHLIMQVHYKVPLDFNDKTSAIIQYTNEKPKYSAGLMPLSLPDQLIPAGVKNFQADMSCKAQMDLTLFAFMTHAHNLGSEITGYIQQNGALKEFARGDPQKPQTFHIMHHFEPLNKGDVMNARCSFDGTRANKTTSIGFRTSDAMCKLFVMYFFDPAKHPLYVEKPCN